MAAQLAISLALSLKKDRFIIEGDSEVVVLSLKNPILLEIGGSLLLFLTL
jgi:hypothetical protein